MLKNKLYNHANARFHTKLATNHITGNNTHKIGLTVHSSTLLIPQSANVANNKAATQTQTIHQIKILPKNDHIVTSLGALSNIDTSDFFWSGIVNWEVQIGGIPHEFIDVSDIVL